MIGRYGGGRIEIKEPTKIRIIIFDQMLISGHVGNIVFVVFM